MSISVVSTLGVQAGSDTADLSLGTFGTSPATGDTIVVLISTFISGVPHATTAPTDTYGNTYVRIANLPFASTATLSMWAAENIIGGAGFKITIHNSGVGSLSGIARCLRSSLGRRVHYNGDLVQFANSSLTIETTDTAAPAPPDGSFFIASVTDLQNSATATWTVASGWNDRSNNGVNNSSSQDLASEDFLITTSLAKLASWTGPVAGGFGQYVSQVASFSELAVAPLHIPRLSVPSNQRNVM